MLSAIGVMFTADHDRAAAELVRVCRPGGRIGVASWTLAGSSGRCSTLGQRLDESAGEGLVVGWDYLVVTATKQ